MFSYTDDAIVTSSPTGRHLSTVIRRPVAIGPLDWSEHADQVCKVLNELDRNAKLNYRVCYSLGAGFQTVGRVYRQPCDYSEQDMDNALVQAELMGARFLNDETFDATSDPKDFGPLTARSPSAESIAELEKQLDDATTKLCAAQMLLEQAEGKIATLERRIVDYRTAATNRGN